MNTTGFISERTGIAYDLTTRTIENACSACSANGEVRFSTKEDLERFDAIEDPDYFATPEQSGVKICQRCDGTGVVIGDGPLMMFKLSASRTIQLMR